VLTCRLLGLAVLSFRGDLAKGAAGRDNWISPWMDFPAGITAKRSSRLSAWSYAACLPGSTVSDPDVNMVPTET